MKELEIGKIKIPYKVIWSEKRASIGISIDDSMELKVKAPTNTSFNEIKNVLDKKKKWILNKIKRFEEQKPPSLEKEFLSGEKLKYRGRRYRLKVQKNQEIKKPKLKFQNGTFNLYTPKYEDQDQKRKKEIKKTVENWYKNKAEQDFPNRVYKYAPQIGVKPNDVIIDEMNKKWGECKKGEIKLHWKLILAPVKIQDYVIVHELTHVKYEKHNKTFWHTIGSVMPDYEERMEWLRKNGKTLKI
ncbi:putative metal-dependent hydrolase [Methanonatronarchaeum thermophilum]|uniref:Putative metal-dependent hydrolase n=1 Tax=Methanonatronarchaeum thermophilum TaxID=1927129 RepID=A0A1Y3G9W3_9EURY|nr:SprT family zinc-dependent metalloprotease [Methanonatronarchaeum thermophilum]OUJ18040.1 putative metal-dependent hydrolase [Methanonatronarchaeum thermophilum]